MGTLILLIFGASIAFFGIGATAYFIAKKWKKKNVLEALQMMLFLVRLPKGVSENKDQKSETLREIGLTEQLINSLAAIKKPFVFEVAVPHVGEEIHFFVAVPHGYGESARRNIQALWNDAQVDPIPDYNVFNYSGVSVAARLKQSEHYALPIRTYQEIEGDTFLPILGGFTKIEEIGEGAAVQFVARPAPYLKKRIQSILRSLKQGQKPDKAFGKSLISFSDIREAVSTKQKEEQEKKEREKVIDESAVKALEAKLAKPLYQVNARIVVSAGTIAQADGIFNGLASGFSQFSAPGRNNLQVMRQKNPKSEIHRFTYREFDPSHALVLNSEEFASMFHFPTSFTATPRLKYMKSKEAPPPQDLVTEGVLIGESVYRGERRAVRITDNDRRRHVYAIGQTGTGKSNLLTLMTVDDIRRGKGVGIIDPHGDLVDDILGLVPKERYEDVVVFDPANLARPIGLNMLEYDFNHPEEKTFIINELLQIFDRLYDLKQTGGPMFEQYMRYALLLLMEDMPYEPATLMEVARIFTDEEFRERKLVRSKNPLVIDFWEKEAVKVGGEASLQNIAPYVTSKFNTFVANDYTRLIIGQAKSSFNFRRIMDEGKILLVNLSKGRIGDLNANLLGMIIVGKILFAALSRVDIPQEERRDFNLFIDEFQNFTTDSISTILSEARKYRLNLTIAHQFIAQLSEKIRDSVFGNVGSIIAFRVGSQDAEFLVKQFAPVFNESDLINNEVGNACVRLLMRNEPTRPFNIKTPLAPKGDPEIGRKLRDLSFAKYGRPREEVEAEIFRRLRDAELETTGWEDMRETIQKRIPMNVNQNE